MGTDRGLMQNSNPVYPKRVAVFLFDKTHIETGGIEAWLWVATIELIHGVVFLSLYFGIGIC